MQTTIKINGALYSVNEINSKGRHYYQVKIPVDKYPNGRIKYKTCSAPTVIELAEKVPNLLNKNIPLNTVPTVTALTNEWFSTKRLSVSAATIDKIESVINIHIIPKLGRYLITDITEKVLQNYVYDLSNQGNEITNKGLGINTIKKILSALNQIIEYAIRKDYIEKNYLKYVSIPKNTAKPRNQRFLSDEDVKRFMKELNRKDDEGNYVYFYRNAIRFGLLTGLRTCELFGLKKDMVDFENNCIFIKRNRVRTRNRDENGEFLGGYSTYCVDETKNRSSMRTFPLTPELKAILQEQMNTDSEYVFPNTDGSIVKPTTFDHRFKTICQNANVDITPYSLRHTFATNAYYDTGLQISNISRLMGHSQTKVTETTYMHLLLGKEQKFVANLEKMYDGIV